MDLGLGRQQHARCDGCGDTLGRQLRPFYFGSPWGHLRDQGHAGLWLGIGAGTQTVSRALRLQRCSGPHNTARFQRSAAAASSCLWPMSTVRSLTTSGIPYSRLGYSGPACRESAVCPALGLRLRGRSLVLASLRFFPPLRFFSPIPGARSMKRERPPRSSCSNRTLRARPQMNRLHRHRPWEEQPHSTGRTSSSLQTLITPAIGCKLARSRRTGGQFNGIFINAPAGPGVYALSAMMFMSSASAEAYITFSSSDRPFLTLLFADNNQVQDGGLQPTGCTFPRNRPFLVQVTITVGASATAQIVVDGTVGNYALPLYPSSFTFVSFAQENPGQRVRCHGYCCARTLPNKRRKVRITSD